MDNEELKKELASEALTLKSDHEEMVAFEVEDQADYDFARDEARNVIAAWRVLEAKRTGVTKPLNGVVKEINSWFKKPQATLKMIEKTWKKKMGAFEDREKAARKLLLDAAFEEDDIEEASELLSAAAEKKVEKTEGASSRITWKYRLKDIKKVPREHLILNERSVKAVVKAMGEDTNIPGIEVYSERVTSVRQ